MNCCNHDCEQGRDCPVRKIPAYPHVPSDMQIEYIPTWRDRLSGFAACVLAAITALACLAIVALGFL